MSSLITAAFPGQTLYDILGAARDVTPAALKKCYYKAALQYHPDKAGASAAATARFQALSLAHSILSDAARRREYDVTGEIHGDGEGGAEGNPLAPDGSSWDVYWRREFPAFDERDIDAFAARYRSSKEEVEDILAAFAKHEGDMDAVLDSVPCSEDGDADRFAEVAHAAIAAGTAESFPNFVRVYGASKGGKGGSTAAKGRAAAARATRTTAEAKEADEFLSGLRKAHAVKHGPAAGGGEPSLAEMMRRRAEERATAGGGGGLIASLEERYGGVKAKKAAAPALRDMVSDSPKRKKKVSGGKN